MQIETLDDILNELADKLGVYGCCKAFEIQSGKHEAECLDKNPCCCRMGFMFEYRDRIENSIENEKKLDSVGL